jgi:hypothetical protein
MALKGLDAKKPVICNLHRCLGIGSRLVRAGRAIMSPAHA